MKWFEIPSELVPKLRELQKKDANHPIVQKEDAVVMHYGMGDPMYLTFDGRVIIEHWLNETPLWEAKTLREAAMALVLGAEVRKFPELLSLLPERPSEAFDCGECKTSGWIQLAPTLPTWICEVCGGLGWQLPESENIIE